MANFQLGDTEKVPYSLIVLDGDSNPATLDPTDVVTVDTSDTASASVVADAVPADGTVGSGWVLGGAKLQVGVVITATVTPGASSKTKLMSTSALIDIVGGVANSISLGFGAPVAQ